MYSKKDDINNTSACEHMKIVVTVATLTIFFKKDNFEYKKRNSFQGRIEIFEIF